MSIRGGHDSERRDDRADLVGRHVVHERKAPMGGASTKGIRPSFAFLSRDVAPPPARRRSRRRTGEAERSSSRSCRETVSSSAMPSRSRQAGLGDDPQRDRLAVGEARVPRGGLERVTDRVAVVQDVTQLGLTLVALDDGGLESAEAGDDPLEHGEIARRQRARSRSSSAK